MRPFFPYLISLCLVPLMLGVGCSTTETCDGRIVWVGTEEKIQIPANDRLFICGDPKYPSWKDVPPKQSANFLKSYLESKAYLDPKVEIDYEKNQLRVEAGKKAVVTALITQGTIPPTWSTRPLESYLGEALEKRTLDELTAHALTMLKSEGYACAKVELQAHPDGRVVFILNPGPLAVFTPVKDVMDSSLDSQVLDRYSPFRAGKPFDIQKLTLAGKRIEGEGIASSAQLAPVCAKDGTLTGIDRSISFGPARSWEVGFGASTEEYPLAIVRWRNSRLWGSASSTEVNLFGSNRRQKIEFSFKGYIFETDRELYLKPGFQIERRIEEQYQTIETKASTLLGKSVDSGNWELTPEAGFAIRRLKILDSASPRTDVLFTPEVNLNAHTHDFELYRGDPRSGADITAGYDFIPGPQASSIATHRFLLDGTKLLNYKHYRELRWVLGLRYSLGTLLTSDGSTPDPAKIPPDWFFLKGGDEDLRGFGRNSLPTDSQGAGSAFSFGFESRWPGIFSFPLEPLLFTDAGWLGDGNFKFRPTVYLSPGLGFRSATPFGTIRVTYARGMIPALGSSRPQFFLSFGTEF